MGVEVEQETSAPPPKKNPGSAPVGLNKKGLAGPICISWQKIYFPSNFTFD